MARHLDDVLDVVVVGAARPGVGRVRLCRSDARRPDRPPDDARRCASDCAASCPTRRCPRRVLVLAAIPQRGPGKPDRAAIRRAVRGSRLTRWQDGGPPSTKEVAVLRVLLVARGGLRVDLCLRRLHADRPPARADHAEAGLAHRRARARARARSSGSSPADRMPEAVARPGRPGRRPPGPRGPTTTRVPAQLRPLEGTATARPRLSSAARCVPTRTPPRTAMATLSQWIEGARPRTLPPPSPPSSSAPAPPTAPATSSGRMPCSPSSCPWPCRSGSTTPTTTPTASAAPTRCGSARSGSSASASPTRSASSSRPSRASSSPASWASRSSPSPACGS